MKKNRSRVFFIFLGILFLCYIILYASVKTGYYQSKVSQNTVLTNEQIKKFEEDISQNKELDLKKYLENRVVDNSNVFSDTGLKISETLEKVLTEGLGSVYNVLRKLIGA